MEIWNVRNIYINSREGRRAWVFKNGCNTSHGNWGGIAHTVTCREGALCVQHCNLIIEVEKLNEVINPCKGLSEYGWHFEQNVYDANGIIRSIKSGEGSGNIPKTIEVEKLEEIKELGGLEEGSSQRRKVFDENGVSPTLQAAMGSGGGNVPMVVERTEVKELGFIDKGTGKHQSNVVYDKEGLSPCICAALGVKQPPTMTVEQTCVAMRGRNPENPSDRTPGIELEQRLEINDTGCTNTLTTVQKYNLVLEKSSFPLRMVRTEEGKALRKDYEAGNIHHGFNEYREPECRTDGVSNTVTTVQKDTLLLEKEQVLAYDEQNQAVRTETFGTLTTDGSSPKHNNRVIKIKQATKQGFIECEIGGGYSVRNIRQAS